MNPPIIPEFSIDTSGDFELSLSSDLNLLHNQLQILAAKLFDIEFLCQSNSDEIEDKRGFDRGEDSSYPYHVQAFNYSSLSCDLRITFSQSQFPNEDSESAESILTRDLQHIRFTGKNPRFDYFIQFEKRQGIWIPVQCNWDWDLSPLGYERFDNIGFMTIQENGQLGNICESITDPLELETFINLVNRSLLLTLHFVKKRNLEKF